MHDAKRSRWALVKSVDATHSPHARTSSPEATAAPERSGALVDPARNRALDRIDSSDIAAAVDELRARIPTITVMQWHDGVDIDWVAFSPAPRNDSLPESTSNIDDTPFDWQKEETTFDWHAEEAEGPSPWDSSTDDVTNPLRQDDSVDLRQLANTPTISDRQIVNPPLSRDQLAYIAGWAENHDLDVRISVANDFTGRHIGIREVAEAYRSIEASGLALLDAGFEPVVAIDHYIAEMAEHFESSPGRHDPTDDVFVRYVGQAITDCIASTHDIPDLSRPALVLSRDGRAIPRTFGQHVATIEADPTASTRPGFYSQESWTLDVFRSMNIGSAVRDMPMPTAPLHFRRNDVLLECAAHWTLPGVVKTSTSFEPKDTQIDELRQVLRAARRMAHETDSLGDHLRAFEPSHPMVLSVEYIATTAVAPVLGVSHRASAELRNTLGALIAVHMRDGRDFDMILPCDADQHLDSLNHVLNGVGRVAAEFPGVALPAIVITDLGRDEGLHKWDRTTNHARVHLDSKAFELGDVRPARQTESNTAARAAMSEDGTNVWWVRTDLAGLEYVTVHELVHNLDAQAHATSPAWQSDRWTLAEGIVGRVGDGSAYRTYIELASRFDQMTVNGPDEYIVPQDLHDDVSYGQGQTSIASIYATSNEWEAIAELGTAGLSQGPGREHGRLVIEALQQRLCRSDD